MSRAKPPLVARGLRRLCVHRKISISSGTRRGEGQVTRKVAGDAPLTAGFPLPVLLDPRRGGPCGPQALILSDTPHHHPKHENLEVPAWQVP